jgi:signal transduction histidine kinase
MLNLAHQSSDTRQPVPMALLVERALALMHEQLQRTHIQVTVDMPDDLLPVSVAPGQIIQVLLNLAINAVEAMPNGGHLHVAARVYGSMIALTMINDSPPLPPEHIARIFDPFFTTKMDGAGLGLYISRQIIQRHDGTIGVENLENGQGVAFTLTLPRADVT